MIAPLLLALASAPSLPSCSLDSLPVTDAPTMTCLVGGVDTLYLYHLDPSYVEFYGPKWGYDFTYTDGGAPMVAQGTAEVFEDRSARLTMMCTWTRENWDAQEGECDCSDLDEGAQQ